MPFRCIICDSLQSRLLDIMVHLFYRHGIDIYYLDREEAEKKAKKLCIFV